MGMAFVVLLYKYKVLALAYIVIASDCPDWSSRTPTALGIDVHRDECMDMCIDVCTNMCIDTCV